MEITFSDALKVINRFRKEEHFAFAALSLEGTFRSKGAKAAMAHARRIAAAYRSLRIQRVETRTQELRRQADRMGLRYV